VRTRVSKCACTSGRCSSVLSSVPSEFVSVNWTASFRNGVVDRPESTARSCNPNRRGPGQHVCGVSRRTRPVRRPVIGAPCGSAEPLTMSDSVDTFGADDGIRTRDPHLGKVMLYQLSHVRVRVIP
jgi:hypothetical protein